MDSHNGSFETGQTNETREHFPTAAEAFSLLPDELLCHLVSYLTFEEVLNLTSVNRHLFHDFGGSTILWKFLAQREGAIQKVESNNGSFNWSTAGNNTGMKVTEEKKCVFHSAYLSNLPRVEWFQVKKFLRTNTPTAREGHNMIAMGSSVEDNRMLVLTGGFHSDSQLYILPLRKNKKKSSVEESSPAANNNKWINIRPTTAASFVYGASLTPLDKCRAVRFGGFRGGGYSSETSSVWLLTLEINNNNGEEEGGVGVQEARWNQVRVQGTPPAPRAYHTATLLCNRYLVIIGGMQSNGCILQEAILDTQEWTWLQQHHVVVTRPSNHGKPSARHGHSVILDQARNRLVLFGGASGSDLLRSGRDNSEVWQLKLKRNWKTSLEQSFPWKWTKIHADSNEMEADYGQQASPLLLSRKERLCLGRCHASGKTCSNMVVFAFGSGRESTNRVLAYNLKSDKFHRPAVVAGGRRPIPRFTAASVVEDGWLVVHGGYSVTNHYGALGDVAILDLAPGSQRDFEGLVLNDRVSTKKKKNKKSVVNKNASPPPAIQELAPGAVPLPIYYRILPFMMRVSPRLYRKAAKRMRKHQRQGRPSEATSE